MTVFHSSIVYSCGCLRILVPALLTRMSSRPNFFTAEAISARQDSGAVTSTAMAAALAPASVSVFTALALFASSRPATTIVAPAAARPSAMPKPIPPLPPVTMATRPPRSKSAIPYPPIMWNSSGSLGRGRPFCQRCAEGGGDDEEHHPGADEDRPIAEGVDAPAAGGDAGRLAEKVAEGEEREGEAARLRRHLRCVGLQRVVQHVEPGADDGDRRGDAPWRRRRRGKREGDGERDAASQRETAFAETRDERPHRRGIDKAADAERGEKEADI